jgi:phage repressor protein C with HTH and peptisase S24 domain
MIEVNNRFLEVYEYLLERKYILSKREFMDKIGISSSMFTEISKGRSNVGMKVIQNTVNEFPFIDLNWWISGKGEMLLSPNSIEQKNSRTYKTNYTNSVFSEPESDKTLHPKKGSLLHPTLHPTNNLGHPQVITVNEKDEELVTLVSVKAAAGYLNGYADPEYIESLPTIKFPGLKGGSHRAFEVKGQSMMPTLHNSCIAIARFEESFNNIKDRRIYVIVTKYDGIVVKRVLNRIEQSGKLILLSDNQNKREYPNIIMEADEVLQIWYLRAALGFEFHEPNELYNRFNDLEAQVTILQDSIKKLIK